MAMDFLKNLLSIFSPKGNSVIGIDIGSSAIKVVQIKKRRGRAVLETYGELALGPYAGLEIGRSTSLSNEKTAEALKDILRESKTTTRLAGVALPLTSSLVSFITVPSVPDKQMSEVIALEARKYIPVPMNEVMMDYSPIPREESYSSGEGDVVRVEDKKNQDFLVVAIHNEYINNYQIITSGAGIEPSFYEIELFSSIRSVLEQGIQAQMIIDMGARITKLYIVERGILRASHVINRGGQDITMAISKALSVSIDEAENLKRTHGMKGGPEYKELTEIITVNLDYIFYEANTTMLNYQKKYMKNISRAILTGGGVLLKGLTELSKVSLQTEVVYADPFGRLETPAFFVEQLKLAGPEFAVAIGCALRRLSELD